MLAFSLFFQMTVKREREERREYAVFTTGYAGVNDVKVLEVIGR
jgi:hypothetical protein